MKSGFVHCCFVLALSLLPAGSAWAQAIITTVAGTEFILPSNRFPPLAAPLGNIRDVAADASGNFYFSDEDNHVVFRLTPDGQLEVVAGNGIAGYSGDGGAALNASLLRPRGVAVDGAGNLFISETGGNRIRRVSSTGIINTFAGTGRPAFSGDNGAAVLASLNQPRGLAIDRAGNLFVADSANHRLRRISPTGIITTVAGNGDPRGGLNSPGALAIDDSGIVFVADNEAVRVLQSGTLRVLQTFIASGLAVSSKGELWAASAINNNIAILSPAPVRVVAGTGVASFAGDKGSALQAAFNAPNGLAGDRFGNIVVADGGNLRLRKIDAAEIVSTIAGNGLFRFSGDNGPARSATLNQLSGVSIDNAGGFLLSDLGNNRIRRVQADGTILTVAGHGTKGFSGDFGPATMAALDSPQGVAAANASSFFVVDQGNNRVRYVGPDSVILTAAGGGASFADGIPGTQALLRFPWAIAVDKIGNAYFADALSHRVRRIAPNGVITTIAGTGLSGFSGDGGPGTSARLSAPRGVAVDSAGRIFISDTGNQRVRVVGTDGRITTIAGGGVADRDGVSATSVALNGPRGISVDLAGSVYVAEALANRVRQVSPSGTISTVAGTGTAGFSGDGGTARAAQLNNPTGVAVDAAGLIYIADSDNHRVRVVLPAPPAVSVSPTSLAFTGTSGGDRVVERTLAITSAVSGVGFAVSVETAQGGAWLSASPAAGSLPSAIGINADPKNLDPGIYQGRVIISMPNGRPSNFTIPVTLTVSVPSQISLEPSELTFSYVSGTPASSRNVRLIGGTTSSLPFTVAASSTGGSWLSVAAPSGTTRSDSAVITVVADPGRMAAGTYGGLLSISIQGQSNPIKLPVTMTVSNVRHKIALSQSGLAITAVAKGGSSASQSLGILDQGDGGMNWTAKAVTLSGGDWLRLSATSGRVERPLIDLSTLEVSAVADGLAPGEYYGRINFQAPADNSPQVVTVLLTVLDETADPGPEVRPTSLVFTGTTGANPGSQNLVVSNLKAAPVSYSLSQSLDQGFPWLVASPPAATVAVRNPIRIVVQPDFSMLPPGLHSSFLTLGFENATRRIPVLGVVSGVAGANAKGPGQALTAEACISSKSQLILLHPPENFRAVLGQPTTLQAMAVDDCGNSLAPDPSKRSLDIVAAFSNSEPAVRFSYGGDGKWSGTWRPLKEGNLSITTVAVIVQGLTNFLVLAPARRSGTVAGSSTTPIVAPGSLVHAATFAGGLPVAPGSLISVFGANLSKPTGQVSAIPLPEILDETEIELGGRRLPLLYVSEQQVNAQVPFDIPSNTQHQVVVRRGTQLSVPEVFAVAAAQPGIFTKNNKGFGQGIILKSDQLTLAEVGTPADRGEVIVIYCTGLGAVTPNVASGVAAPIPAARTVNEVALKIDGRPAQVLFSGLTPGFAGLYQVNAIVPAESSTGDSVTVTMEVAGQTSPVVLMAVR